MRAPEKLLLAFALVCLSSACVLSGPDYVPPKTELGGKFNQEQLPGASAAPVDSDWWKGFEDAELNKLVDLAISTNHDVQIALANLRSARAERRAAGFDLFPKVTSRAAFTERRISPAEFFAPSGEVIQQGLYEAGFDAAWELDLFGRVRSGVAAASAEAQAAEAEQHDTLVSVIAEVARNYFELRGIQRRVALAQERVANQRAVLQLAQKRVELGRGTPLDVASAREQLNNTMAAIPPLEAAALHAVHRLGVLCGQPPEALAPELSASAPLPDLKHSLAIGDPAGLLRRRPDIRVAERKLAADAERVKVSTADLFPRVEFLGTLGFAAQTLSAFGDSGAQVFSAGPSITWSAFDLGRVRARLKAAGARADASLAAYEQTVLKALEETENALVDYGRERTRRDFLRQAGEASQEALGLAQTRYEGGVDDLSVVLEARRRNIEAQETLAGSETNTGVALVAVYKALGGGWESTAEKATASEHEPPPAPRTAVSEPADRPQDDAEVIHQEPHLRDRGF